MWVVGVGENSIDLLATVPRHPAPDDKLELQGIQALPGGQVASALIACARQGCSTRYLGTFGDDENARLVEEALRREGVDTSCCRHVRAASRSAIILVDPVAGTRTVLWQRAPALSWPVEEMTSELISDAGILLVDATDLEASVRAASLARQAGITVVADVDDPVPGLERLLANVDILIAAQGLPHALTGNPVVGRAMPKLQARFDTRAIVVTLGAGGAVAWDGRQEHTSPGFVVPVVDPTGAGDAFRGGFIAAWLEAGPAPGTMPDLGPLMDRANATAALSCRAVGAQTGLPTRAEVLRLLTDRTVLRSNSYGHGSARGGSR